MLLFSKLLEAAESLAETLRGDKGIVDKTTNPRYRITGCFKTQKLSEQERLKLYPFDKAVKIEVVAFKSGYMITEPRSNADNIDYSMFSDVKQLSDKEISELSDIILNIDYTFEKLPKHVVLRDDPTCYDPHNAIILTDDEGNHFAWIEVCFGCKGWRTKGFKLAYNCDLRFQLFEKWFEATSLHRETS